MIPASPTSPRARARTRPVSTSQHPQSPHPRTSVRDKLFEASQIIQSEDPSDYGAVLGFVCPAEQPRIYWVDERLAALDKGLRAALGIHTVNVDWIDPGSGQDKAKIAVADGADARIISWSGDRQLAIVEKSGPRLPPGTTFLIRTES